MAETSVEDNIKGKANKETPQERLENVLRKNNVKTSAAENSDSSKDEERQAKVRAEVDKFLQMREENKKLFFEREKLWR